MRSLIFWIEDAPFMTATPETSPQGKSLLLIVDDDPLICDTLSFSMSPAFEIVTSHSRPHCMQMLQQLGRIPELALVDLGLPPFPHRPDEGFALIADLLILRPTATFLSKIARHIATQRASRTAAE